MVVPVAGATTTAVAVLAPTMPGGAPLELVWHVAGANEFGHDRRADRAANAIQAFDDFGVVDRHVAPVDLGVIDRAGGLHSLRDADELIRVATDGSGYLVLVDRINLCAGPVLCGYDAIATAMTEMIMPSAIVWNTMTGTRKTAASDSTTVSAERSGSASRR